MVSERLQPHDIGAEESVIGSILIDGNAITRITSVLRASDFYSQRNRKCYEAALALYERGTAINQVTMAHEIAIDDGALEMVGGAEYLARLVSNVPTSVHIEHYAAIVHASSLFRQIIRAGAEISDLGYDGGADVERALDRAEEVVFGIRSRRGAQGLMHIRQFFDDYMEMHGAMLDPSAGSLAPVNTGFPQLDELLGGGMQRSDLLILAARPSLGKSTLALNMARQAADHDFTSAVFSLEMSGLQIAVRMLASEADVDSHRMRMDLLNDDEDARVLDAIGLLSDLPIYIDETPFQSVMEMRSKSRRLQQEAGLDLVIVDYLQLVDVGRNDNRAVALGEVSRALKGLARELDIPVLACSQLSRAVEQRPNHRPLLSDLRESGCLAGDTLITLADSGRRAPIRDLAGASDFAVWALNEKTYKLERALVSKAFSTGVKPVLSLSTQLGRSIRATANHKFLTLDGWKRLDEIEPGERIAIPRSVSAAQGSKGRDQFHAIVSGKEDIERFISRVGAVGQYKTAALDSVAAFIARKRANTNRDVIPALVWPRLVKPAMAHVGMTHRQLYGKLNMSYAGMAIFKNNLSRQRAAQVAEAVSSETLKTLSESDVYWDKVVSIEPDGVEEVFDLTVPGPHNFVANDVIAHNSIEQDADVVAFIHREDQYLTQDEWERKFPSDPYPENIAEVIVSKHRNGPTGAVPLYFRNERVRFESLTDIAAANIANYAPEYAPA